MEYEYLPGKKTKVWAYNKSIPGPTLHANVGDTLEVNFINNLPEPSTLHWHGLELPANMDGSHISQKPVQPGESFVYRFKVLRAATYWFHSHVKTNEQVEKGLYGALIVHDPAENKKLNLPKKEMVFLLDDILLNSDNQISDFLPEDPLERAVILLNGRQGNHIIINGKRQPNYKVKVGEPIRMRFINASSTRFFRLSLPGQKLIRIGGDTGLLHAPVKISNIKIKKDQITGESISDPDKSKGLLLLPGERAEVLWTPKAHKSNKALMQWHDLKRGRHITSYLPDGTIDIFPDGLDGRNPHQVIFSFSLQKSNSKQTIKKLPKILRKSENLHTDPSVHKKLKVIFGHGNPDKDGNVMFFAQAMKHGNMMMPLPYMKLTNKTALNAQIGETRIIEVVNMSRGIHPFHIHGFPFQLIETKYIDDDNPTLNKVVVNKSQHREWKDTIFIPGRTGFRMKSKVIVRLAIKFDDKKRAGQLEAHGGESKGSLSGGWFVHCHILEHARYGMATWLNLWK